MLIVGIDENGLGPLLGPMVITATVFRAHVYDPETFWRLSTPELPASDSKQIFQRNRPDRYEATILQWLQLFGLNPQTADALRHHICISLPLPCPQKGEPRCRPSTTTPLPLWSSKPTDKTLKSNHPRFHDNNIEPLFVTAISLCPGRYHEEIDSTGRNKLQIDFESMMTLIQNTHATYPNEPVTALCGKVGGTRCYLPWFHALNMAPMILSETRQESRYRTEHGTIAFIRDGDAHHFPIALASMVGKYLREIEMYELNVLLGHAEHPVSGYRDTRTARFVRDTTPCRSDIGLPDRCFVRKR